MSEEQAVEGETNDTQSDVSEGADAQDDLDSLLKQFEEDTQEGEQQDTDFSKDDLKEAVSYIKESQEREWREKTQADIEKSVKSTQEVLQESGFDLPDNLVEGYLNLKAQRDRRVLNAFNQRQKSPDTWNQVLKGVSKELVNTLKNQPDKEATSDHEAVASAVRSASTKTPEPDVKVSKDSLDQMSDREFNKLMREMQKAS